MADISQIQLRGGATYDIKDATARAAIPAAYAASPSAGGPATVANAIHYGVVDSTSTSTKFTAQISGITEYYDGLTILLYNGKVTSASGYTININGLGAYGSYSNMALGNTSTPTAPTRDTTIFNINYAMLFVFCTNIGGQGTTGWIGYRGYDANTNTIGYQIRTNSSSLPMTSVVYRYRLLFTSADRNHFVPANNSTSTNATSARTDCQDPIDPFGRIVYYGTTTSVAASSRPSASYLWQQYTLTFGYSFQTSPNYELTSWKPIYLKCAPQSNGSAIIDATTPFVQDLPSTEDGKIYIFLGVAYSTTSMELTLEHPVYYYKDGAIRNWTNAVAGGSTVSASQTLSSGTEVGTVTVDGTTTTFYAPTPPAKTSDLTNDSGFITSSSLPTKTSDLTNDSGFISSETDPTVPAWAKAASKPTYTASEVGALPSNTSIPSKTSDLTNDSGFISTETDPTVPSWAKAASKPTYTASEVGALPSSEAHPFILQNNVDYFSDPDDLPASATVGTLAFLEGSSSAPTLYNELISGTTDGTGNLVLGTEFNDRLIVNIQTTNTLICWQLGVATGNTLKMLHFTTYTGATLTNTAVTVRVFWLDPTEFSIAGSSPVSPADYVVEYGVDNGWEYKKWNSGLAECYKVFTDTGLSYSAWGSGYYATVGARTLPSGLFISVRDYVPTLMAGNDCWLGSPINSDSTVTTSRIPPIMVLRFTSNSSASATIGYHVYGSWK